MRGLSSGLVYGLFSVILLLIRLYTFTALELNSQNDTHEQRIAA